VSSKRALSGQKHRYTRRLTQIAPWDRAAKKLLENPREEKSVRTGPKSTKNGSKTEMESLSKSTSAEDRPCLTYAKNCGSGSLDFVKRGSLRNSSKLRKSLLGNGELASLAYGSLKELLQIEAPIRGIHRLHPGDHLSSPRGPSVLTQGTIDTREPRLNEKAMPRYSELEIDHGHHPSCDEDPPELDHKPDKPLRMNPAVVGCRMSREPNFRVFFTSRLTEPLPDGHSCSRWANTRPRNFCTAGSIVGFPSAGKHGLKRGPKLV
jgi:hypothetical protein